MFKKFRLAALTLWVLGVSLSFAFTSKRASPQALSQEEYPITVNMRKYPAWMEMPVQVTEIRVKGKRVELDVPFLHTEDWLRDFSVVVKNISDKPILGLSLNLEWATDPNDGIPYIPETFIYAGQQFQLGSDGPGRKLVLKPGETVEVFVEESWWESHNNHIAGTAHEAHKQISETIRRSATLTYEYAGFDRDIAWVHGFYLHRDPNNQNRFIMDENQRKRVSRILKQAAGQARMLKASYIPGASLPWMSEI